MRNPLDEALDDWKILGNYITLGPALTRVTFPDCKPKEAGEDTKPLDTPAKRE